MKSLQLAASIGIITEIALVTPLFIAVPHLNLHLLPHWIAVLQRFQVPGAQLSERAFRTNALRHLIDTFPPYGALHAAQLLAIAIQALIFALIALGVIRFLASGKRNLLISLLRKRVLLTLFLPPAILILIGTVSTVWPVSELLSDSAADILVTASSFWLVLASLVVGTTLAVTWKALGTDGLSF